MRGAEVVRFGAFTLAPGRGELLFRGSRVSIGSRAFDLLTALIERRGQLAAKDDLMAEVWGGRVVDENNLAAQISALRKILAGDPDLSECLLTVPGRGYRFVAQVDPADDVRIHGQAPGPGGADSDALSLIVLPFISLSGDIEQTCFAQGLSQTISTDLSRISGLVVIAFATAATIDGRSFDAQRVSRDFGARYLLTGSVQRIDRNVRINAQLVDGRSGLQVWSELFDGDDSDLFALQDRITGRIANSIGREIFVAAARDGQARTIDPKARDFFMRGIAADNRPQSLEGLQEQEGLFERAIELDLNHGDAWARLARAILLQATQVHAPSSRMGNALAKGVGAAERAMTLDPGNSRAHFAMGLVHVLHGDFERSALANETAIALDRNFALAHNNLGNSLLHLGEGQVALVAVQTALRLDPRGPQLGAFWTTAGFARLQLGETSAASECFFRARNANLKLPRAHVGLAVSLAGSGDIAAARRATADLLRLVPHYRLSQTIDACLPASPPAYRRFYENVLEPGAVLADVPL
jgi:TolB-like protein/Flp pilus assembly protein TadD